ncbi:bacterial cell division membrane protein [Leptolinea tardivitalis]|nr:bacterial cell division membrane protein [Leptolinea tardivitalis]
MYLYEPGNDEGSVEFLKIMFRLENWRHFDYWLFGTATILSIFGIIMIRSAVAGSIELAGYANRQTMFVVAGLVVVLATAVLDYHFLGNMARAMYIFAVVSLIVIYIYGQASFGSARWLDTGVFFIQPSELVKIIMVIVLSDYFSRSQLEKHDLMWIGKSAALTFGVVIWILLQPNLSTSIVITVLWISMLWISGLPPKYIALFIVLGIVLGLILFPFLESYQQLRIINFLFPDPNSRHGNSYNVEQALISIGSGGWFGMGYGHGTQVQLRFLKVRHTDFIFSAMAEEFGFVGTVLVISLLVFVIYRCFRVAREAQDQFGALIAYGVGVLLAFQTSVNIGVNLNVIPVTGLVLPFISYGGSSLLSTVLAIGLVESVALRRKPLDF